MGNFIFEHLNFDKLIHQLNINIHSLKPVLKELLYDHFIQQWFTYVENSSRGEFTRSSNLNLDLRNTNQNYQSKIGLIYQNLDVQI
jgi:hypothetical protein